MRFLLLLALAGCGAEWKPVNFFPWDELYVGERYQDVVSAVGEPCRVEGDWPVPKGPGPLWEYQCYADGTAEYFVRLGDGEHITALWAAYPRP